MIRSHVRVAVSTTLVLALAWGAPGVALAEPGSGSDVSPGDVEAAKKAVTAGEARVAAVQKQLDEARAAVEAAHTRAEVAAEAANAARARLAEATQKSAAARAAAVQAGVVADHSQLVKDDMAAQLYMRGASVLSDLAWLGSLFGNDDPVRDRADDDAAATDRGQHVVESRRAQGAAEQAAAAAKAAEAEQQKAAKDAAAALAAAQKASDDADAAAAALDAKEKTLVAELAQLRRTSVEVEAARQKQLQEEAAAREAARVQAQMRARASRVDPTAVPTAPGQASDQAPGGAPVKASGGAATAIAFAQQQIGKPYLWGGNGPDSYDCSGLMVAAWGSAGRSLPRTAQWQYDALPKVPLASLQPGDLVFYGGTTSSIHHVGMYIGGGRMIEAPRTGLDLRYASIYRSDLLPQGGRP